MEDSANKTPQIPERRQDCASECLKGALRLAESLCSCPVGARTSTSSGRDGFSPLSLAIRKHMLLLSLPVPLPLQQLFAHHRATWSAHISLPADRKFPVPGSVCVERQFISHASSWLKQVTVAFALLSPSGRAAGRGEDKARRIENRFTLMDVIRELHLLWTGQASSSSCLLSVAGCPLELLFLV